MPLVEQELLTIPEHLSSPPIFSGVRLTRYLIWCVCFVDLCLSFFFWPWCCLSCFDLRILKFLITPLVSSNSSERTCLLLFGFSWEDHARIYFLLIKEQAVRGAQLVSMGMPTICWKASLLNITNMLSIKTSCIWWRQFKILFWG